MNGTFFIVGGFIFTVYVVFLSWAILTQHSKQKNNPSELDFRNVDTVDLDGMGNFSRFGPESTSKRVIVKKRNKKKV